MQDAELVDMSFGTGAVKITPAHDPNDFKTGQRHSLPMINVFDDVGSVNSNGGQFEGQPRFEARRTVAAFLEVCCLFAAVLVTGSHTPHSHRRAGSRACLCGGAEKVFLRRRALITLCEPAGHSPGWNALGKSVAACRRKGCTGARQTTR